VLAIDPGRDKCGLAVVFRSGRTTEQAVVPREDLMAAIEDAVRRYRPVALALGDRTGSRECRREVEERRLCPIVVVDEHETTIGARIRYFHDNPPRGWRRLIPVGMQTPPRPVDDYAAVLLGEAFWAARRPSDRSEFEPAGEGTP